MKTIRLLYPGHLSGGLDAYWFGAHLLQHILPATPSQPLVKVDGICARSDVLDGRRFHSACFANPELAGDGSGGAGWTWRRWRRRLAA